MAANPAAAAPGAPVPAVAAAPGAPVPAVVAGRGAAVVVAAADLGRPIWKNSSERVRTACGV